MIEYFDAFLVGLTATQATQTFGFFNRNLVVEYDHERTVADGGNVDFEVYTIRTKIVEHGSTIEATPDTYGPVPGPRDTSATPGTLRRRHHLRRARIGPPRSHSRHFGRPLEGSIKSKCLTCSSARATRGTTPRTGVAGTRTAPEAGGTIASITPAADQAASLRERVIHYGAHFPADGL